MFTINRHSITEATRVKRRKEECQRSWAFVRNVGTSPFPFPPWATLANLEHELLGNIICKTHVPLTCLNCSEEETPTGCLVSPVPGGFPLPSHSSAQRAGKEQCCEAPAQCPSGGPPGSRKPSQEKRSQGSSRESHWGREKQPLHRPPRSPRVLICHWSPGTQAS